MRIRTAEKLMAEILADYPYTDVPETGVVVVGFPNTELQEVSFFDLHEEPSPDNFSILATVSVVLEQKLLTNKKVIKWIAKYSKSAFLNKGFVVRLDGDRFSIFCCLNNETTNLRRCREALELVFVETMRSVEIAQSMVKPEKERVFVPSDADF